MGLSARHTRRILAAYREKGAAAIAHGNRGRSPANATPSTLAIEAVRLARTRYAGVNHTHLSELLREREGIDIGRDTLRRILTNAGVNSPRRRRPPKHRVRRQRMPREGMLIQVDGSYHRWLGKDGPQFTLLLAIDDATGIVVNSLFCELENTHSYFSAPRWTNKALRHTDRALFRSACRIQVHSTVGSCRCSNPVQSCDGRAWRTADIRSITSGQGSCRTRRGNVPGQARYGAAPCGRDHHRRCEPRAGGLPSTLQRPLQGTCAGVGSRLSRCGRRGASGSCSVLQVPAQSRQGQHGQIPLAHTSTAALHGPAELRRSSRECA